MTKATGSSEQTEGISFPGRVLFLTEDVDLIRSQIQGADLGGYDPQVELAHNISTDEMTPVGTCFYYDETLGHYSLVGLRGEPIAPGDLKGGGFSVIVSGESKGCGSSRDTAPYSELYAGIRLVIARSILTGYVTAPSRS